MKTSKLLLATVLLQFGCIWTLVITSPQHASAQTSGTPSGASSGTSSGSSSGTSTPDAGWPNYGHDAGGTRYSPATQINRDNVAQLKVAWTYRTGALDQVGDNLKRNAAFEATPILVDGRLCLSTPFDHVIALEPERKFGNMTPSLMLATGFRRSLREEFPRGRIRRQRGGSHVGCGFLLARWMRD